MACFPASLYSLRQAKAGTPTPGGPFYSRRLFWCDGADDASALLGRRRFEFTVIEQFINNVCHHAPAFLDVRHFTSAEYHGDLHLVFLFKELLGPFDLEVNVMLARLGTQSQLLGFCLVRVALVLFFTPLVLVLSIIHDSADRGRFLWGHLHQIQPIFTGDSYGLFSWNDSQLLSVGVDYADRRNANLVINPDVGAFDRCSPFLNRTLGDPSRRLEDRPASRPKPIR